MRLMMDKQNKHEDDESCHEALQTIFKTRNSNFLYKTVPHTYLLLYNCSF